jgi:hypothetical protein
VRGLLMAQLRHGDFSQELCVQKADCQLAAKGGANTAIEISFQDRSKSAERSRRPLPYLRDQALPFWAAELRRAFPRR